MSIYENILTLAKDSKIGCNIKESSLKCDELYRNIYYLILLIKDSYKGNTLYYLEDLITQRKLHKPNCKSRGQYDFVNHVVNRNVVNILIQHDIKILTKIFVNHYKQHLKITPTKTITIIETIYDTIKELGCDILTNVLRGKNTNTLHSPPQSHIHIKDYQNTFNMYMYIEDNLTELNNIDIEEILRIWDYPKLSESKNDMINKIMKHLSQIFSAVVSSDIASNFIEMDTDVSEHLQQIRKIHDKINIHKNKIDKLEKEKESLLNEIDL
jgi:hypothetical protein